MFKKAWLFFPLMIISCVSLGKGSAVSDSAGTVGQGKGRYVEISMQDQGDAGLWVSGPLDGNFIIVGVSGRLSRPDDELVAAKEDAARKAAMYHGIQGSVEMLNTTGSGGFFDYSADSKLNLNYDTNYSNYLEKLTFDPEKDVIRITGGTFVRFKYSVSVGNLSYVPMKYDGRPSWVNGRSLPEFEGYATAVGHAGRRSRLRDTVNASCDSAVARLIETASTMVNTDTSVYNESSYSSTYMRSEGRLSNFKVLAIWLDPDNGAVSTLAIARVSK